MKELSEGIYQDCLEFGPESIQLCSSYYYMGLIFQQMNKNEETKSIYSKVVEIWKNFILEKDFHEDLQYSSIDDIYYEEAKDHLKNMLIFFEVEYGPQHVLTAECELAFALVMLKTGDVMLSLEYLQKAMHIFANTLGEYDEKTQEVDELIKKVIL
jgi:tetratricopeptide (TPR) repeat protein